MTVTCGPPTSVAPASGVAASTHASAAVTMVSPLDVLTIELELAPALPIPDCPPKATLIVIGDVVVLVKLSSQRPQFALYLAVEARRRRRLHEDLDAGEAVDRCAVPRSLSRSHLCRADAAGVHARRSSVLDAPPSAVGVGHVIERGNRSRVRHGEERESPKTTASFGECSQDAPWSGHSHLLAPERARTSTRHGATRSPQAQRAPRCSANYLSAARTFEPLNL